jgi:hypothetical protein
MRSLVLFILALSSAAAAPPAIALTSTSAPASDLIIATFEDNSVTLRASNAAITRSTDRPAEGKSFIELSPIKPDANVAQLRLPLPAKSNPAGRQSLAAALRAPGAAEKVELGWYALDAKNRPLFQRRFDLAPGETWVRLDEPLNAWRWDNRFVGDWDEVTTIAIVIATPNVKRIDLDDVRFTGVTDEQRNVERLLDLAFAKRPRQAAHADGLLVATDAVDAFAPPDLDRLLDGMRRTRTWLRNTFGDADRPTDDHHAPATLLIFKSPSDYPAFYERLGQAWRVTIAAPGAQGYTVQDMATSTYDPKLGTNRPVYFHESIHAVVARELRLLPGNDAHKPMQEAIANFLQVCVHPKSLPRSAYVKNFARPIDPSGNGFFKPLEMLFTRPVTTKEYAQLASVVAFLLEKDQNLLRELIKGLADGETATQVLARNGVRWPQLQNAWFTWGQQRFRAGAAAADDAPAFSPPPEFR